MVATTIRRTGSHIDGGIIPVILTPARERLPRSLTPPQGVTGYPATNLDRGKQRLEQGGTEKMEKELHFSVCSVPSAFLLQSRRDDPKSAQGGAHVSETSVRATLGCEDCPQRNPEGVALREGGNDGSIIGQGDRSFRLQFRAAPSGLWISVATLPRVARTLAELAFAPPWAGIGLCLRHGRSLCVFTNETPAQPEECSTLHHNRGNVAFPGGHAPTRERLRLEAQRLCRNVRRLIKSPGTDIFAELA